MPDVVVVGAGVMGASIALELQRSGRSVLVVDRGDAVGAGSTSASSAVVRFNYSTLAGVIAAWESAHRWADWAPPTGILNSWPWWRPADIPLDASDETATEPNQEGTRPPPPE